MRDVERDLVSLRAAGVKDRTMRFSASGHPVVNVTDFGDIEQVPEEFARTCRRTPPQARRSRSGMAVHAEYALVIGGMRPPTLALLSQPIGRHAGPQRR